MLTRTLNLDDIRIDGATQAREAIHEETVAEYVEAMLIGVLLPAVIVFFDGVAHWLADGFHRYHAARRAGRETIEAEVRNGSQREAVLYSVGANAEHGLRRSNADKRKAILTLLNDAEWRRWSDAEIARRCKVSDKTVARLRVETAHPRNSEDDISRTVTRAGKTYRQTIKGQRKSAKSHSPAETVSGICDPSQAVDARSTVDDENTQSGDGAVVVTTAAEDYGISDLAGMTPEELQEMTYQSDPVEDMDRMLKMVEQLQADLAAATADDARAETVKWRRMCEYAQREYGVAMDRAHAAGKREKWVMNQLRRCGRAVGVDNPLKIAAAVEGMARQHRKANSSVKG